VSDRPTPETFAALIEAKRLEVERLEGIKIRATTVFRDAQHELGNLLVASKPEQWPTPEQLEGIRIAVRKCRDGEPTTSHHGNACGPESAPNIAAWEERGFVRLPNNAPYLPEFAGKAWLMGDDELEIARRVIEEEGATVVDAWLSDGLSFNIKFEAAAEAMVLTEEFEHLAEDHPNCKFEEPGMHGCSCHLNSPCGACEKCPSWSPDAWEAGRP